MRKDDLAKRLARRRHISTAKAADQLDTVVHDILRKLRSGKCAPLPGVGVLTPGKRPRLRQEETRRRATGEKRRGG
ncbi:MAG: hypothetical protein GY953_08785 [bacterium]|nr:hypothetical protein [bacterium]